MAAQNMRVLIAIFILIGLARNCFASDSWTCSYVGFGADSKSVTIQLLLRGDKLIDRNFGAPRYDVLENNEYAVIAADHSVRAPIRVEVTLGCWRTHANATCATVTPSVLAMRSRTSSKAKVASSSFAYFARLEAGSLSTTIRRPSPPRIGSHWSA